MSNGGPLSNVRIVLCETSHPGNIGAAARAMKTMELASLHLVRPQRYPHLEARSRASRAVDVLDRAIVHDTLDDALRGVALAVACTARVRDIAVPAFGAREAAQRAIAVARSQPTALVFGNETYGLTTADVNKCDLLATIPANPAYSSLNLGAAVQVLAYELRMAAAIESDIADARALATHEEVEGFYEHLQRELVASGFLDPEVPKKLMPRIRRLFARAQLDGDEVNILRGILNTLAQPRNRSQGRR
jgi:tRNA/rRNA methyltransferase